VYTVGVGVSFQRLGVCVLGLGGGVDNGVAASEVDDLSGETEVTLLDPVEERVLVDHAGHSGAVDVVGYGLGEVGVHGCGGVGLAAVVTWTLVMAMVVRWEEGVRWRLDLVFFLPCGFRLLSVISRAVSWRDFACLRSCCCTFGLLSRKMVKKGRDMMAWVLAGF
jgi:hypothetical protein